MRALTVTQRVPLLVGGSTGIAVGVLFLFTGVALGDFALAWEVLVGVASPFADRSPTGSPPSGTAKLLTVALSAAGYLILPVIIGIAASGLVNSLIGRQLIDRDQARDLFREELQRLPPKETS